MRSSSPWRRNSPSAWFLVAGLCVAGLALGISPRALAGNLSFTGSVDRTSADTNLTVTITGIKQTEKDHGDSTDPQPKDQRFAARFKILTGFDQNTPVPYTQAAATAASSNVHYYATETPDHTETFDSASQSWTYVYYISMTQTDSNQRDVTLKSGNLQVSVFFYLGTKPNPATGSSDQGSLGNSQNQTIGIDTYVVSDAPTFSAMGAAGSNHQVTLNWDTPANVNVLPSGQRPATSITAVVVDRSVVTQPINNIPAKHFTDGKTADTPATCTYTPPTTDAQVTACITCDAGNYMTAADLNAISGFQAVQTKVANGTASVTGLSNERFNGDSRYVAFLFYEPNGVQQSQCVPVQPSANFSMTELNGEGEAKIVDFRCFIATAAYGTPFDEHVRLFRLFRDEMLLTSQMGRNFVDLYYTVSPPIADFIAVHPQLRAATRMALSLPAWTLRTLENLGEL